MSHTPCCSPENIASPSQLLQVRYLSWLLARGLVLCFLAKVLHPLVFWQEILLLGHFLPISSLVWRLPERTGKHINKPKTRSLMSPEDNAWNENMSRKRSINKTYPLSTRKESLHVLPFLFNWNLENDWKEMKKSCQTTLWYLRWQNTYFIFKCHPCTAQKERRCVYFDCRLVQEKNFRPQKFSQITFWLNMQHFK